MLKLFLNINFANDTLPCIILLFCFRNIQDIFLNIKLKIGVKNKKNCNDLNIFGLLKATK